MKSNKKYSGANYLDFLEAYLDGSQPAVTKKINTLMQKPIEEFYDLTNDPGCWNNLADNVAYFQLIDTYRNILNKELVESKDPDSYKYTMLKR